MARDGDAQFRHIDRPNSPRPVVLLLAPCVLVCLRTAADALAAKGTARSIEPVAEAIERSRSLRGKQQADGKPGG